MDEPIISYSARELLERLDAKLEAGFAGVNTRLDNLGGRVTTLEIERSKSETERESHSRVSQKFWNALASLATVLAAVATALSVAHGF